MKRTSTSSTLARSTILLVVMSGFSSHAQAQTNILLSEDFEPVPSGWTTNPSGTDNATSGFWDIGNPSFSHYQNGTTPTGVNALVTGWLNLTDGDNDVDTGTTTVSSPAVSIAATAVSAELSINYYFRDSQDDGVTDNTGDNQFSVAVVSATTGNVSTLLNQSLSSPVATPLSAPWYVPVSFDLGGFIGETIQILFSANGESGGYVEASVDDFVITENFSPGPCPVPFEPPAPGINTYDFLYLAALSDANTPITSDDGTLADSDRLMLAWQRTTPPFPETLTQSVVDPAGFLWMTRDTVITTVAAAVFASAEFDDLRQYPGTWTIYASDTTGLVATLSLDVNTLPTGFDSDVDGIPNTRDPDDDNDGICDGFDFQSLIDSNECSTNDGTNATLMGSSVSDAQTCAAKESVDVSGTTNVGIDGDLRLISEKVSLTDTSVTDNGRVEVINADPCPGCTVCGNGILETPPEQCDDGNTTGGDGCSAHCLIEE